MKKYSFLFLLIGFGLLACNKENNDKADCGISSGICFKMNDANVGGAGSWYRIPGQNRFRLLWETGNGASYQNLEIDIYTADSVMATGSYAVDQTNLRNTAAVQYYAEQTPWYGTSGTVEITAVNGTVLEGTFNAVVAKDGTGETRNISGGQILSLPLQ